MGKLNSTIDDLVQDSAFLVLKEKKKNAVDGVRSGVSKRQRVDVDAVLLHPTNLWIDTVILSRDSHQLEESQKVFRCFDAFRVHVPLALEILFCFQDQVVYRSERWLHRRIWELGHPEVIVSGRLLNFTPDQYPRSLRHDLTVKNLQHFYAVRYYSQYVCILGHVLFCSFLLSGYGFIARGLFQQRWTFYIEEFCDR